MTAATFEVLTDSGRRRVQLAAYLDDADRERAAAGANAWIKNLRHAIVDGQPLRRRFTFRGDSLWWFAELYLHKEQQVLGLHLAIAALERLVSRERPRRLRLVHGDRLVRLLAPQVASRHGVPFEGPGPPSSRFILMRMDLRARWLHAAALASRLRRRPIAAPGNAPTVAAFVHRAFWRTDTGEGSAEAYLGPVLEALERRAGRDRIVYVSVGPSANFRARKWWHPLRQQPNHVTSAVESYAPREWLAPSRALWRERRHLRAALWQSADLQRHARLGGYDCWPIVREELSGIALLQWPWSARAMDEAGAALDVLQPRVVVTYAEAGGWGRALVLECRRRGIPSVGLQHGFIYRHWLNYLHEPDEMEPDAANPGDSGFPRPTSTLLFDGYTADHLVSCGRFPGAALRVTGSARLDALVAAAAGVDAGGIERVRAAAGCGPGDALVLVTTKLKEARHALPALLDAADHLPGVRLAIKAHPAETPEVYEPMVRNRRSAAVLPASADLAALLRACRAVVTVNSTVALDAAVLGVPGLVIGLPNNLSPFVEAGVLAGAADERSVRETLDRILYDEEFRQQLERRCGEYLPRMGMRADGDSAERAAESILSAASG